MPIKSFPDVFDIAMRDISGGYTDLGISPTDAAGLASCFSIQPTENQNSTAQCLHFDSRYPFVFDSGKHDQPGSIPASPIALFGMLECLYHTFAHYGYYPDAQPGIAHGPSNPYVITFAFTTTPRK